MLKLICATKCSNIHMYTYIHSQDSLHFNFTLAVLRGATLPHLKRGTAALEPWHCHDLSDSSGLGGIYTFPFLSNVSLLSLNHSIRPRIEKCSSLSPPSVTLCSQASPLISPSILKRKRCQTRLESISTDSQSLKSTWFTFWPAVVFVTLGAWLLAS